MLQVARAAPEALGGGGASADAEPFSCVRITRENVVGLDSSADGEQPASIVVVVPNGWSAHYGRYVNESIEPTELLLNIRAAASQEPRPEGEFPRVVVPVKTRPAIGTDGHFQGRSSGHVANGGPAERRGLSRSAAFPDERSAPLGWS